jgi:hypothetical protein
MQAFIGEAEKSLSRSMGRAYQNAVLVCLRGDFNCNMNEKSFGMEFYNTVVQELDIQRLI